AVRAEVNCPRRHAVERVGGRVSVRSIERVDRIRCEGAAESLAAGAAGPAAGPSLRLAPSGAAVIARPQDQVANSSLRTNLWIARKRDCIASASKLPAFLGAEGTAPQVQPPSWLLTTRSPFTATAVEPPVAASSVNRPRPDFTH